MSIRVMAEVWARSTHKGGTLLLLLALADHANDSGEGIRAGRQSLRRKIRAKSVRTVDALIDKLIASGELEQTHSGGNGPRDTHQYRIIVANMKGAESAPTQKKEVKGAENAPKGADIDAKGANPPPIESSIDPSLRAFVGVVDEAHRREMRQIKWLTCPSFGIKGKIADRFAALYGAALDAKTLNEVLEKYERAGAAAKVRNRIGFIVSGAKCHYEEISGLDAWDTADKLLAKPDIKMAVSYAAFTQEN